MGREPALKFGSLLDDRTSLLDERADGEVAHRLPERFSGFLDQFLEIRGETEVKPEVLGRRDRPALP
jgi:hypothetical protein